VTTTPTLVPDELAGPLAALPAWWAEHLGRPAATDGDAIAAGDRFLRHESRLLDGGRHAEWYERWEPDGLLWFPLDPGVDIARHQCWALDDHRRLGERLARLADPAAWSQRPRSRTVRQVDGVEAWADGDGLIVASTLVVWEQRGGTRRAWPARQLHALRRRHDGLAIVRKAVALLDATDGVPNHSFLL
jgi:3-phenylpropionate/cinnamic acid dioxygenase small subunit